MAVNTTAGTGAEMTRFCIITDEVRHVKRLKRQFPAVFWAHEVFQRIFTALKGPFLSFFNKKCSFFSFFPFSERLFDVFRALL